MEAAMRNIICTSLIIFGVILCIGNTLNAQALLDDDTLFIGSATALATEQVVIPVYLKTTHYVQGWQMPILFGTGETPAFCDSVSTVGTAMQDWVFQAPFKNNYTWDNVQTCGIAGLKDWMGGSIDPGYHLVMNLYFTIDDSPVLGTYVLDTTRASWTQGGPLNAFIITVSGTSYITHVVPGELTITSVGINEEISEQSCVLQVYPTIARVGEQIMVQHDAGAPIQIHLYDGAGRIVDQISSRENTCFSYNTRGLNAGVYFIATEQAGIQAARKVVLY